MTVRAAEGEDFCQDFHVTGKPKAELLHFHCKIRGKVLTKSSWISKIE